MNNAFIAALMGRRRGGAHICTLGPTWAVAATPIISNWLAIAGGNGVFLLPKQFTTDIYRSVNQGASWTLITAPGSSFNSRDKFQFSGDRFVFIEKFVGSWRTLDDGLTYTFNGANAHNIDVLIPVAPHGFFMAGNAGVGYWSADGDTFNATAMPGAASDWSAGASGFGVTVALTGTTSARSLDGGQTWTATGAPPAGVLTGNHSCACVGPGIFVACQVNPSTQLIVSTDAGLTWHFSVATPAINIQRNVISANGVTILTGGTTQVFITTDGDHWVISPNAGTTAPFDLAEDGLGHYFGVVASTTTATLGTC